MTPADFLHPQSDADLDDVERDITSKGQYRPIAVGRRLWPEDKISDIWPEQPPGGHLHIFIRLPSRVSTADDAHAELDDFDKPLRHVDRFLNDCPGKGERVPPIALLYAPFGRFVDHIRDRPKEQHGVDLREFQFAVDEFASVMCECFRNKGERRDKVLPLLNAIFNCYYPFTLPSLDSAVATGKRTGGGYAIGPAQLIETIVEFRDEYGSGHTDPEVQTTSSYLQMFDHQRTSGRYKNSLEKFLCPTLVITITGSYIGFGALVLLDTARFVALTPLLPAHLPPGDVINRSTLFQAFRAACVLRHDIHEDTRRVISRTTLTRIRDSYLPYVQEIPAWPPSEDRQLEFRILGVAYQDEVWNENSFLFHAKAQDENVLVKFTRRYCAKLHEFCAMSGHAPRLLGYGTVPGGWNVVVMEDVKHKCNHAGYASRYWAKWYQDLTDLMHGFHDMNLVHGDLRANNIIVPAHDPENIMLIDFDWGGEAGKVSFPTWSINEELIDGDRLESLVITKEHDVRVLTAALEHLRPVT